MLLSGATMQIFFSNVLKINVILYFFWINDDKFTFCKVDESKIKLLFRYCLNKSKPFER